MCVFIVAVGRSLFFNLVGLILLVVLEDFLSCPEKAGSMFDNHAVLDCSSQLNCHRFLAS